MPAPAPVSLGLTRYDPTAPAAAPTLIVAHGLFGSGRNWAGLARRFADDPAGPRTVLALDLRNHGASPWSPAMDYEVMGADLLRAIEEHADGRALLLGHSMGGKAAMSAALQNPDAVAGLIVADMAPIDYEDPGHTGFIEAMRSLDLSQIRRRSDADAPMAAAIPEASLRAFILQNLVLSEGVASWRLNLSALRDRMPDLLAWPAALTEKTYAGPALFYHGGASDYLTASAREAVARQFPAAEIDAMAGAGHWLHAERPDLFFNRVSKWLSQPR